VVDGAGSERWERGWKVEGLQCRRDGERETERDCNKRSEGERRDETKTRRERKAKAKHRQCSERRRAAPRLFVWAVILFSRSGFPVFVTILELLRLEDPRMGGLLYTSSEPLCAMRTLLFTTLTCNI
jgi:hypothetical protein